MDSHTPQANDRAAITRSILATLEAINRREFDPRTSPIYANKSPYWEGTLEHVPGGPARKSTLAEWGEWYRRLADKYPNLTLRFPLRAEDMQINVFQNLGQAEVFLILGASGIHPQLTSWNMIHAEYQLIGGRWYNVSIDTLPGLGLDWLD